MKIGVDIGGTFTDFVALDEAAGAMRVFKRFSTPDDPSRAALEGLRPYLERGVLTRVAHGSTVAVNAVLERKGACAAFVGTRGFKDILAIARQNRADIYDLYAAKPAHVIPPERCFEVTERVGADGEIVQPLREEELEPLSRRLRELGVESVAVCFLFSFLRPEHERAAAEKLRADGFYATASSELLPKFREYERASATALNAYTAPALDRYLGKIERELGGAEFRVMLSNGGAVASDQARRQPARSALSGPAGGAVGAAWAARLAGLPSAAAFDMGGTSTDVSMIGGGARGGPQMTQRSEIDGLPLPFPSIDIHTIGAGGGSIARLDRGGAVQVGPESAGARPGPICYGRGGAEPTVTDANLVLGRIDPDAFLGGQMRLEADAAREGLERLGREAGVAPKKGLSLAETTALGAVQIADTRMEGAVRNIAQGRAEALISFGGAGGLHARELARRLGLRTVLVPFAAAALSAYGMLCAEAVSDRSLTVMLEGGASLEELERRVGLLAEDAAAELLRGGADPERIVVHKELDMRYRGQSFELSVPLADGFLERFHAAHASQRGHAMRGAPVEIVNLRARVCETADPPVPPALEPKPYGPEAAQTGTRRVVFSDGAVEAPFYDGERLGPGHRVEGPAVAVQKDTTVLLSAGDSALVDRYGNLLISVGERRVRSR